jgi:hypothetical protein
MRRREAIGLFGVVLTLWLPAAETQQPEVIE